MLEQISPEEEIIDAIFEHLDNNGLDGAICDIIDKRFGDAERLWRDQSQFVQDKILEGLEDAFSKMDSSLSVSDGWLRLTVQSGNLHATFNLLDHIDEGIKAAAHFQESAEDVAETVSGLNEFIAKLEQLRDSL